MFLVISGVILIFNGSLCLHHTGSMDLEGLLDSSIDVPLGYVFVWCVAYICQFFLHWLWPLWLVWVIFIRWPLPYSVNIILLIVKLVCQSVLGLSLTVTAIIRHFNWTYVLSSLSLITFLTSEICSRQYHLWCTFISLDFYILCYIIYEIFLGDVIPLGHEFTRSPNIRTNFMWRLLCLWTLGCVGLLILVLIRIHNYCF